MIKLLFGIIVIFGIFLLLTGVVGVSILRSLFGLNKRTQQPKNDQTRGNDTEDREKIFGKHEGEYVEYEDVHEKPDDE